MLDEEGQKRRVEGNSKQKDTTAVMEVYKKEYFGTLIVCNEKEKKHYLFMFLSTFHMLFASLSKIVQKCFTSSLFCICPQFLINFEAHFLMQLVLECNLFLMYFN